MTEKRPYHLSIMPDAVVHYLNIKPGGVYVDVTFGGGGHTRAMLEHEKKCSVIALDWDLIALEKNGEPLVEEYGKRLTLVWANFAHIKDKLKKMGVVAVDGIIADFGTSQYQIFEREGFSFAKESYLDMRMSPAHQKITAAIILGQASESELTTIFRDYGQEPKARAIARAIVEARATKRIRYTNELAALVERIVGYGTRRTQRHIHPATQVFQALRIAVNRELDNIHAFLPAAFNLLKPGGRLACITFHSLEDRMVKQFFKEKTTGSQPEGMLIEGKGVVPSDAEKAVNKSARSARMRIIERL